MSGAIERAIEAFELGDTDPFGHKAMVKDACAELAALREENARLREALTVNKHTDECLRYAAETGRDYCIASCADLRAKGLSVPAPSTLTHRLVSVERLAKLERLVAVCCTSKHGVTVSRMRAAELLGCSLLGLDKRLGEVET